MASIPGSIRVMCVDDHAAMRRAVAVALLAFDDLELVGEAANGREAVEVCERAQPDVVLMDLRLPDIEGPQATRLILARCPQVRVLGMTAYQDAALIQEMLDAGARGCLLKNSSAFDLANAIRSVHREGPDVQPVEPRPATNGA